MTDERNIHIREEHDTARTLCGATPTEEDFSHGPVQAWEAIDWWFPDLCPECAAVRIGQRDECLSVSEKGKA